MGVFGTFGGIVIGLWDFQPAPDKIQESIQELLGGLKIAFLTSLVGIGSAIILKGIALIYQMRKPDEDPIKREMSGTNDLLNSIRISLSGTDERTIFTELQALQTTFEESNNQWIEAFGAFSERVVGECTDLLVKALQQIVHDYNAKINEQLGENFKQFNESVGEINVWQAQYRQQMDELANEFRIAAESIEQSRGSLASAAESLTLIGNQSEKIVSITDTLDILTENLNDRLETFPLLREQAVTAFPEIKKGLDDLTSTFSSSVEKSIADSQESLLKQHNAMDEHVRKIRAALATTTQQLTEVTKPFSQTTETIQKVWYADLEVSTQLYDVIGHLTSRVERLKTHLDELDRLLERQSKKWWKRGS